MASMEHDSRPTILQVIRGIFSFPHPVNEVAARWVAGMVVVLNFTIVLTNLHFLMSAITYGCLARVLTGPNLSPMGLLATRVLVPRFGNIQKLAAGPPKRFAQFIGLLFSATSPGMTYWFGLEGVAKELLSILGIFGIMESCLGFCAGCFVFGYLMKWGVIPVETCKKCADIQNLRFGPHNFHETALGE